MHDHTRGDSPRRGLRSGRRSPVRCRATSGEAFGAHGAYGAPVTGGTRVPAPAVVYRRRRWLAALTTVVLGALLKVGVASAIGNPGPVGAGGSVVAVGGVRPRSPRYHSVRLGESLWVIARRERPRGDIRRLVRALAEANGGIDLRVGQRVLLPRLASER